MDKLDESNAIALQPVEDDLNLSSHGFCFLIVIIFLIGAALRLYIPVVEAPLFVNDGGMHYVLAKELIENGFILPKFTSYNFQNIPFAYPPLSTYLTAVLSVTSGLSIETILRYVPALLSCAVLLACFLFFKEACSSKLSLATAFAVMAALPYSYLQQIKGGGISRSLGALFAILAIHQITRLHRSFRSLAAPTSLFPIKSWMPASIFLGLTFLSHPEWSVVALSYLIATGLADWRSKLKYTALRIFFGATLIAIPWVAIVYQNHGLAPFLNALQSGEQNQIAQFILLRFFGEINEPVLTFFAYVGLWKLLTNHRYVLPLFILVLGAALSRGYTFVIALPLALCIGEGVPYMCTLGSLADRLSRLSFTAVAAICLGLSVNLYGTRPPVIESVSNDQLAAFDWIRRNTPDNAEFIVIDGATWWRDFVNELFPLLANRQSATTCQGREWLAERAFLKCVDLNSMIGTDSAVKLRSFIQNRANSSGFDYLLLSTKDCLSDRIATSWDSLGPSVFTNASVRILKIRQ